MATCTACGNLLGMKLGARLVALLAALALPVAACSDNRHGAADNTSVSSASTPDSGSTAGSTDGTSDGTAPSDSASVDSTGANAGGATSTVAGAGTTAPGATPEESDPFASTPAPDPTEADDTPAPPADDCVDADPAAASVELVVDDDHVRYAGEIAPSCVRVHANQPIVIRSASVIGATVQVGADSHELESGGSFTVPALGVTHQVGDVVEVFVEDLDVSVLVQVLP